MVIPVTLVLALPLKLAAEEGGGAAGKAGSIHISKIFPRNILGFLVASFVLPILLGPACWAAVSLVSLAVQGEAI